MNKSIFEIVSNICVAKNTYAMRLSGDVSHIVRPGQFVNIKLDGCFLRRPVSVCDVFDSSLLLLYKTVGEGTEKMSVLKQGEKLDLLCGLGNGFDTAKSGALPLIVGGGMGAAPMLYLAKKLKSENKTVTAVLGFGSREEIYCQREFEEVCDRVVYSTADGSFGTKGFVTDALFGLKYTYFYACGPEPMLKAMYDASSASGEMSFEERMGCGFGACMGCSCKTKYGAKRICTDGPVLTKEEVIW